MEVKVPLPRPSSSFERDARVVEVAVHGQELVYFLVHDGFIKYDRLELVGILCVWYNSQYPVPDISKLWSISGS